MSNAVQLFDFNANKIRVTTIKGEPWFVAADVCRVLGLNNPTKAMGGLDKCEVTLSPIQGQRGMPLNIIKESGLYKLAMRSDKPEAKPFQDWVAKEVLPSIRKTGAYVKGQPSIETQAADPLAFMEAQMGALSSIVAADVCRVLGTG
jgi:prophage antirepressor-like protein